ncbi:MAG: methyltransferase domain-containing protein [Gemmatimonadaceae bacterium]|nr:methyltransferase domain-containing protein [Gemmatimonadaceae bacterium]
MKSGSTVDLSGLEDDELVEALAMRFDTAVTDLDVGGRVVRILRPRNSDDLIREEDFVMDERLPYWADIWPSSTILAERFVCGELGGSRSGDRIPRGLELGCGVGLVTTAAMIAGYDMIASDYYTDALAFTRANAFTALGRSPVVRMIDWRHFPEDVGELDLIVASDVLYEKEYARLLPGIFRNALAPGGMAVVADPGRVGVPEFMESCGDAGLEVRSKVTYPFEAEEIKQKIDIYQIAQVVVPLAPLTR